MGLKTVLIIAVTTARMIFPGIPSSWVGSGGDKSADISPAAKTLVIYLSSDQKANSKSWAEVAVPEGLKVGSSVKLEIDLSASGAQEGPAAAKPTDSKPAGTPDVVSKSYWGCGETVLPGQPEVKSASTATPAQATKPEAQGSSALPDASSAYWPGFDAKPIESDASAAGKYTLTTNYCGGASVTLDKEQDFLGPIDLIGLDKQADLDKPIKIEWKSVPNALAYLINAYGGNRKESIMWTSSAEPNPAPDIEYSAIARQDLDKLIEKKVVLPANATSCIIPAKIFKGSDSVMLTLIAIGSDKSQEKDGVQTRVVVRSSAGVPLYTTPWKAGEKKAE